MQECQITREMIISNSHLPISIACISLNMEVESLKKVCRLLGFNRWPYNARKEMSKIQKSKKTEKKSVKGLYIDYYKKSISLENVSNIHSNVVQKKEEFKLPSFQEFVAKLSPQVLK